jgi:hypothetical protein
MSHKQGSFTAVDVNAQILGPTVKIIEYGKTRNVFSYFKKM